MAKNRDFAIIDIETTGGDPKVDRITEIAVIRYNGKEIVDSFTSLINPEMPIPPYITRITGIDNDMIKDAPKFYEVAKEIVEITQGTVFVAHNVRFDYSFVQKEFRQLAYTFTRPQLCTVKLSRKVIPGHKSYSLGNICRELGIPNEARHRAWGDASATVKLLEHLLMVSEQVPAKGALLDEMAEVKLPPHLSSDVMQSLPEETGVYYFLDKQGRVLYVGKSNNVRKRILSHFSGAHKAVRTMRMLDQIYDITFELTGSELIALLLENEEIKRIQPPYNRAQRRKAYKYGVYTFVTKEGYLGLKVDKYDEAANPVAGFSGKTHAESALKRRGTKYQLCPKLYGAEKGSGRCFHYQLHICQGACIGDEAPETYNERVEAAIHALNYGKSDMDSFLVVGEGRNYQERSVVWVEEGRYKGYGYLEIETLTYGLEAVLASISFKEEAPDVQRIIQGYIKRHPKEVKRLSA
ncbi:MAG: exonuclease domain-containing protein, partial [Bacteroidota bacterium]